MENCVELLTAPAGTMMQTELSAVTTVPPLLLTVLVTAVPMGAPFGVFFPFVLFVVVSIDTSLLLQLMIVISSNTSGPMK
jgi:hypothetical protein